MRRLRFLLGCLALVSLAAPAAATITIPGANNGSDGALNVTSSDLVIDLSKAVTGSWDQAGAGLGVYDSTKWAVVFKYTSVNIASGRTVTFINHPSNAPVVWLVQGIATIAGTVKLDGETAGNFNRETVPGPGGFAGGRPYNVGSPATAGHGPGGGPVNANNTNSDAAGAYGTAYGTHPGLVYGNSRVLPILGGSGGGGLSPTAGGVLAPGGAGGGAILMVVGQKLVLTGMVQANGGSSTYGYNIYFGTAGSGGGIRCVADTISGNGNLLAMGGNNYYGHGAGEGRVRLEANVLTLSTQSSPTYTLEQPLDADGVVVWPPAPQATVRIATINGQPATGDPHMDAQALASGDLVTSATSLVPLTVAATNVPITSTVTVRVVLGLGSEYTANCTFVSGDATSSTWSTTLSALSPNAVTAIQAKAILH